jgi:hypothetical protein
MGRINTEYYEVEVHFSHGRMLTVFNILDPEDNISLDEGVYIIDTMEGAEVTISLYNVDYIMIRKAGQTVNIDKVKLSNSSDETN